jgi:NIMA (never in mitosis gene a)-related kinase
MERLKHPNIIGFREVYTTLKGRMCIVMAFADGGDLQQKIAKQKESKRYFREVEVLN